MKIFIVMLFLAMTLIPYQVRAETCTTILNNPPTVIYVRTPTPWHNIITHVTNGCSFTFKATITGGALRFTAVSTTTQGISCSMSNDFKSIECSGKPLTANISVEAVIKSDSVGQSFMSILLNSIPSDFVIQTISYPYNIYLPFAR